jgi:hypothetical protein
MFDSIVVLQSRVDRELTEFDDGEADFGATGDHSPD